MLTWLEGKKLYITTAVGILAILVNHFFGPLPGIDLDSKNWLTDIFSLIMVAVGGAKVQRIVDQQKELVRANEVNNTMLAGMLRDRRGSGA